MPPLPPNILRAVEILRSGGLVAFPTETVYGLGADATNAIAVERIFAAKGRPPTNPLIVHVADADVARQCASAWPESAQRLAERFWPGPLTLVLPKHASIVARATAGLDTVGLRCPDHPLALAMLREFAGPVAAPSANRSTRISPTTAAHVRDELGDCVDFVLDGGPCRVGIESTVLDLTGSRPRILRPGAVTADDLAREIGPIEQALLSASPLEPAMSPGQQLVHYAPRARAFRFDTQQYDAIQQKLRETPAKPSALVVIGEPHIIGRLPSTRTVQMPSDAAEYAQRLYATLRELDLAGVETIWIEMPPPLPQWHAVRDRLLRATTPFEP